MAATTTTYTGPSVREMLDTHTLGKEIMARADAGDDAQAILDDSELALLKRYVTAPESKIDILKELGVVDTDGKVIIEKTRGDMSLVTYIMVGLNSPTFSSSFSFFFLEEDLGLVLEELLYADLRYAV